MTESANQTPSARSHTPVVWRTLAGFLLGGIFGLLFSGNASPFTVSLLRFVEPFGMVLVSMLKMVVFPIIFFSLILGASSLPLKKSGRLGGSVLLWYLMTSLFATLFGITAACLLNPKLESAGSVPSNLDAIESVKGNASSGGFAEFMTGLFQNPFEALANGQFLPVVIFSILFGLAIRTLLDSGKLSEKDSGALSVLLRVCHAACRVSFKIVDWVMVYFPVGVFALTFVNFARNGAELFGPYMRIVACVTACVIGMILLVYPLAIFLFCKENPYTVLSRIREPIFMAFAIRSSAATLPVSLTTAERIGISPALSSFSLPLGSTINMDGVCVHLPVFVILAANLYNVSFSTGQLAVLLASVVLASVGAGGVPGGSIFLLFMLLENAGFTSEQTASIVALALGINPILDMFETACNVAGDNVCTYIVAKRNGLIKRPDSDEMP